MDFHSRKVMIISTNNTVYTRVWPHIWASYNHLLHDEYNLFQCILGVQVRYNKTTYKLLQADLALDSPLSLSLTVGCPLSAENVLEVGMGCIGEVNVTAHCFLHRENELFMY